MALVLVLEGRGIVQALGKRIAFGVRELSFDRFLEKHLEYVVLSFKPQL